MSLFGKQVIPRTRDSSPPASRGKSSEEADANSTDTPLRIRRAKPGNCLSIAYVLRKSFDEYRSSYTPEAFEATTPDADLIRMRLKEGPIWIALSYGRIVGTISAVPRSETLYIRSMAVTPTVKGQGIGNKLLKCVERFALKSGFKRLLLSTTPFLTNAIALYEREGFARTEEGPQDLHKTPLFTMEKTLGRMP